MNNETGGMHEVAVIITVKVILWFVVLETHSFHLLKLYRVERDWKIIMNAVNSSIFIRLQ